MYTARFPAIKTNVKWEDIMPDQPGVPFPSSIFHFEEPFIITPRLDADPVVLATLFQTTFKRLPILIKGKKVSLTFWQLHRINTTVEVYKTDKLEKHQIGLLPDGTPDHFWLYVDLNDAKKVI